jgi:hypothetical protein
MEGRPADLLLSASVSAIVAAVAIASQLLGLGFGLRTPEHPLDQVGAAPAWIDVPLLGDGPTFPGYDRPPVQPIATRSEARGAKVVVAGPRSGAFRAAATAPSAVIAPDEPPSTPSSTTPVPVPAPALPDPTGVGPFDAPDRPPLPDAAALPGLTTELLEPIA